MPFAVTFLDDILVLPWGEAEHQLHLRPVQDIFKEDWLYAKLSNCNFFLRRWVVKSLDYIIKALGWTLTRSSLSLALFLRKRLRESTNPTPRRNRGILAHTTQSTPDNLWLYSHTAWQHRRATCYISLKELQPQIDQDACIVRINPHQEDEHDNCFCDIYLAQISSSRQRHRKACFCLWEKQALLGRMKTYNKCITCLWNGGIQALLRLSAIACPWSRRNQANVPDHLFNVRLETLTYSQGNTHLPSSHWLDWKCRWEVQMHLAHLIHWAHAGLCCSCPLELQHSKGWASGGALARLSGDAMTLCQSLRMTFLMESTTWAAIKRGEEECITTLIALKRVSYTSLSHS